MNRLAAYEPKVIDLEITRKCPIDCPMCPRVTAKQHKDKWMLDHMTLDTVKNVVNIKSLRTVSICGIYGDAIYHPEFHEILKIFKDSPNIGINVETNGAHRSEEWWSRCEGLFKNNDYVTFSIDGIEKNNKIYRINTDWDSIIVGIKTLRRVCPDLKLIWKWIYFKYNQYDTLEGYKLSKELGFSDFILVESTRAKYFDDQLGNLYVPDRPIQQAIDEITLYKRNKI
jgi:MoaA/NifB/PqqE/SkfB family radical SAM enzyme